MLPWPIDSPRTSPEDWQLAPAPMELPTEHSGSQMGSLASSKKRKVAGKVVPLSHESEQGDVGMCAPLPLESEDETEPELLHPLLRDPTLSPSNSNLGMQELPSLSPPPPQPKSDFGMRDLLRDLTPSPANPDSGMQELPSLSPPPRPQFKSDFGMRDLLRDLTLSPTNSDSAMQELVSQSPPPPTPAKSDFGMWDLLRDLTPSPTYSDPSMQELQSQSPPPPAPAKSDFGMRDILRDLTLSPTHTDSGMRGLQSPSPPPPAPAKSDFGMWDLLRDFTPSPTNSDVGMQELLPLSPPLLPSPEPGHASGVRENTPPLAPSNDSDLTIQHSPLPESQDDIGTQTAPPPEPQDPDSLSQRPRWSWGDRAPVPMPRIVGEAEHRDESGDLHASILREGRDAFKHIHGIVSDIYGMEQTLSGVIEGMVAELDDAEVQDMM